MIKKIYIIAPSAKIKGNMDIEKLVKVAENKIKNYGFEIEYSENLFNKKDFLSGTDSQRVSDFHKGFLDEEMKIIMAAQGGDNSIDLLEKIDFKIIKNNPTPFFGMSDITVLLNAIYLKTGLITYHGIDFIWGVGKNGKNYTMKQIQDFSTGSLEEFRPLDRKKWRVINKGKTEGVLLGGCLASFILLLGTKFDPLEINEKYILFLEDIFETPERIAAYLKQLSLHKNFKNCKGIILGNFFECKSKEYKGTIEDLTKKIFSDIVIIKIPEIGHAVENMIMPIGMGVVIEAQDRVSLTKK